jgi:hypothetical protein
MSVPLVFEARTPVRDSMATLNVPPTWTPATVTSTVPVSVPLTPRPPVADTVSVAEETCRVASWTDPAAKSRAALVSTNVTSPADSVTVRSLASRWPRMVNVMSVPDSWYVPAPSAGRVTVPVASCRVFTAIADALVFTLNAMLPASVTPAPAAMVAVPVSTPATPSDSTASTPPAVTVKRVPPLPNPALRPLAVTTSAVPDAVVASCKR